MFQISLPLSTQEIDSIENKIMINPARNIYSSNSVFPVDEMIKVHFQVQIKKWKTLI